MCRSPYELISSCLLLQPSTENPARLFWMVYEMVGKCRTTAVL